MGPHIEALIVGFSLLIVFVFFLNLGIGLLFGEPFPRVFLYSLFCLLILCAAAGPLVGVLSTF